MSDMENFKEQPVDGFPALASFIARDPDHETYVFRKFNKLTARNLLHIQNNLMFLERELDAIDNKAKRDPDLQISLRHWEILKAQAAVRDGDERRILELSAEIEDQLHKYQGALISAREIVKMQPPTHRVLEGIRHESSRMSIHGGTGDLFDDEADLVALKPSIDTDMLSTLIREHWLGPTKRLSGSQQNRTAYFRDSWSSTIGSICSAMVAAVLLMGSILALYFVRKPNSRLGLLMMFIALFAVGIRVCTSASRDNIFAATAAYSAVLVVFVSGNLANA